MKRILVFAIAFLVFPSFSIADPQLDAEPGVQPRALRGVQGGVGMIPIEVDIVSGGAVDPSTETKQDDQITELQAILAKILAAPSTEAKQDDLNALLVIIDAVLDAIKLDSANISADQSTETTSAAILAKILAAPATEAKQDDLNALIVIIDAVLDTIKSDTSNISADQATETTAAAILAKIIASPSTEAKQDDEITELQAILAKLIVAPATEATVAAILAKISADQATETTAAAILAKLSSDPSTETTSAAILAKIIAAPSTEAKQDDLNALIVIIDAVLDLMKTALDNILVDTTEIIANTATATTGAHGTVTITTSATEIRPANANRISLLVHNAENMVVFTGFTGVTVAAGTPLAKSTVDADGKGDSIEYRSTPAIFGIVASGTADVRWTEESK